MLLIKNIKAALKGGRYLAESGPYWKGMTLLSGVDYIKTYELFSALPLKQARHAGGLSIIPQSLWDTMDKSQTTMFVGHYPLFVDDGRNRVNKHHVERVLNGYRYLCELRFQDGSSASMFQGKHQTLLRGLIDLLPDEFSTDNEFPFSSEWFIELYGVMDDSPEKDEFKEFARVCGFPIAGNEQDFLAPHTDWQLLEQDLMNLSKAYMRLTIDPEHLHRLALSSHQTLILPEITNPWERAVISDVVCETINLLQSALYAGETMHFETVSRENYPVFIHLNQYDALMDLGTIAHKAKYSHMAIYMVVNSLDILHKRSQSQTLLAAGFKLFDTEFAKGKGAYGFMSNGLYPSPMEKVYLD